MYKFLISFLEVPYKFFNSFTMGQYVIAIWWVIGLCMCLLGLALPFYT